MTHADFLKICRLPDQLAMVERRLDQLDRVPREERRKYWRARYAAAIAKHNRLTARAAAFGLRDLATGGRPDQCSD
ncbi:hypothetical protein ACWGM0_05205 [Sphingomonas bisphenolicum]